MVTLPVRIQKMVGKLHDIGYESLYLYLSLDYHVLWAWQTKAVPIFFELILVCK